MNYKLELNTQESGSNIVFNNIIFDSFKVNVVERHIESRHSVLNFDHVLFKVRTLDNDIIETKKGNKRTIIRSDELEIYGKLTKALNSYEYKNSLINKKDIEKDYVYFLLNLVVSNYALN